MPLYTDTCTQLYIVEDQKPRRSTAQGVLAVQGKHACVQGMQVVSINSCHQHGVVDDLAFFFFSLSGCLCFSVCKMAPKKKDKQKKPSSRNGIGMVGAVAAVLLAMVIGFSFGPSDLICSVKVALSSFLEPEYTYPPWEHHSADYNSSMLWGSYRPHVYFGMRTRTPKGVLTGITWRSAQSGLRHNAEDGEHVTFGWQIHDGVSFGHQVINDRENGMEMAVHMVKKPYGVKGGHWAVRFEGRAMRPIRWGHYIVMEGLEALSVTDNTQADALLTGETDALGRFSLVLSRDHAGYSNATWSIEGKKVKKDPWDVLAARPPFRSKLKGDENVVMVTTLLKGDFRIEVTLLSHEDQAVTGVVGTVAQAQHTLHGLGLLQCGLSGTLAQRHQAYEKRFEATFHLKDKGFDSQHIAMAKMGLSNYLGGMGYWFGEGLQYTEETIQASEKKTVNLSTAALFSGVPSRSKFPRGFLWDEGFHQLLAARWDPELSKDVLLHWMNLMEPNGWIPREQILGPEPRTRVPAEFVAQNPLHANPPTLTLQIQNFALNNSDGRHSPFLRRVWPYLERWFGWFNRSQSGSQEGTFRWRGRKGYHLLPCGLDDYPRSVCATAAEKHVDLYSWASLMGSTIHSIGEAIGEESKYEQYAASLRDKLDGQHWDPKRNQYSDRSGCEPNSRQITKEGKFLSHFGYMNLFPVLTGIAGEDKAVRVINRTWELMSGFGLRSLRGKDRKRIGQSDNYWTGPIWINLNYLMLRALRTKYSAVEGSAELYTQLRNDLIKNIASEYRRTQKLWENYHPTTGHGQGTAPFTGWTTLIILIMAEEYI